MGMSDFGMTKLMESDQIIVWELVLEPGESTGVHTHEFDYIVYVLEGSTLLATDGDGSNPSEVVLADRDSFQFKIDGDMALAGELQTTATHNAKNIGPGRYREIMVEVK